LDYGHCGFFDYNALANSYFSSLRVTGTPLHPADWFCVWGGNVQALPRVVADEACEGGKALYFEQYGGTVRRQFVWGDVLPAATFKVRGCFKADAIASGLRLFYVRSFGHGGSETGYCVDRAAFAALQIISYVYGAYATFGLQAIDLSADTWYYVRFEAANKNFKVRVWAKGEEEPGAWLIDADDTYDNWDQYAHAYKGYFGIGSIAATASVTWDWIGIGTDGDEAPVPT